VVKDILRALKIIAVITAAPLWCIVWLAKSIRRMRRIDLLFRDEFLCDACGQGVALVGVFTCPHCRMTAPGFYFSRCRLCGAVPSFIRCPTCGVCTLNPLTDRRAAR
jgi:hypothetical protein